MTFTTEFIYSETVNDMVWQNINLVPDGGTTFDGRPTFTRFDSSLRDVIFLTNTDQGDTWNLLFRLQRKAEPWLSDGGVARA